MNNRKRNQENGNFHEETLKSCSQLMKAIFLKNKKLLNEGTSSH